MNPTFLNSIQFNMTYSNNIQHTLQFKTMRTCNTRNVVLREYTSRIHNSCGYNHNIRNL